MPKIRRFEDFHPKLRKRKRLPVGWFLSASFAILFFGRLLKLITGSDSMEFTNLDIATPIGSGVLSPIVFVCCQNLFGREGNQGQLSRRLPRWYKTMPEKIPVDVRYMNAPCFNRRELEGVNPQEHGGDWPIHKSFPAENLQIFRQRIDEIHKQGGIVLAEGNCKIPRTELANVWLESMIDNETGINGTVSQRILDKFSLQDKKRLRLVLMKYGYEKYTPKHYFNTTADLEFPLVLKREKAEGGVGTYIVNSLQELEKRMSEDDRFEGMGTRHKKSRHRTIGSGWLLEEFLKGASQELIVYIRPRGTSDGSVYFWCGSHSNRRWHDDGNFVKGYMDFRGTVTTPTDCNLRPELLDALSIVMQKEGIYGTGCINFKFGKDSVPKIHDWNLRTCATMSDWNEGQVFLDIVNQIPRRASTKKLALFSVE